MVLTLSGFAFFLTLTNLNHNFLASLGFGTGQISSEDYDHWAWSDTVGWIDFNPQDGGVQLLDNELVGYAWGENVGWISFNCSNTSSCDGPGGVDYKVENDGEGNLSGYAWSDTLGWINFNPTVGPTSYGVTVDDDGIFSGYAWGENVGWISFNCSNTSSCDGPGGVDYKVISDGQFYNQVATTVTIQVQPEGTGCYLDPLTTQPEILVKDQHDQNMPDGTTVTASLSGGTGTLTGTLTATTVNGVAAFSNLGYSMPSQPFTVDFTSGSYSASSNAVGPLQTCSAGTVGPSGALSFEQSGSGTQTQTGPSTQEPGETPNGTPPQSGPGPGTQEPSGTSPQGPGPATGPGGGNEIPKEVIPILQNIIESILKIIGRFLPK
jgi:hypothetical protein